MDAYVSVRTRGARMYRRPVSSGDVVFVDVADGNGLERLRSAAPEHFSSRGGTVIVRLPPDVETAAIEGLIDRGWASAMQVGVLRQPLGKPPVVERVTSNPLDDWRRCRRIETHALLEWGSSIWRPTTYHYRLPSGSHAGSFVKAGDAIREPRDAQVLASWLNQRAGSRVALVLDTGTLSAVAEAFSRTLAIGGSHSTGVSVLDRYPRTDVDVIAAVEAAAGGSADSVIALLSTNSSGVVRDRLVRALGARSRAYSSTAVEVIVDRGAGRSIENLDTWCDLNLEGDEAYATASGATCRLCHTPGRATVVPIDPTTFDGKLPTQLRQLMPDIRAPREAASFWEFASQAGAVSVQTKGSPAVAAHRFDERMGTSVDLAKLISQDGFAEGAAARLSEQAANHQLEPLASNDLVLVPEHERSLGGYDDFYGYFGALFGDVKPTPFKVDVPLPTAIRDALNDATQVRVFTLGIVSGMSLQQAVVAIQTARRGPDYGLAALAVHARPASKREWDTLRNSYAKHLLYAWLTFIPTRSPLDDERKVLSSIDSGRLDSASASFHERRLAICAGDTGAGPPAVFWGGLPSDQLTPNSIFGQQLRATSAYAAVGASLAEARYKASQRPDPEQRVFEMSAMFRSYYDPIIIASFLRWLQPHETWWGWQGIDAEQTIHALLERASQSGGPDLAILVPELLLAAAQGKLVPAARDVLIARAESIDPTDLAEDRDAPAALQFGLDVLQQTRGSS